MHGAEVREAAPIGRIGRTNSAQVNESQDLNAGRRRGLDMGLSYAGAVDPDEAYRLAGQGAVLVDVRTAEERKYVGYVPGSIHVAWQTGKAMIKNPRFVKELSAKVAEDQVVLFICRSGKRSADAAAAAAKAGYALAFNVLEGFEGDLDEQQQRGNQGGWRHRGLPWVQQ